MPFFWLYSIFFRHYFCENYFLAYFSKFSFWRRRQIFTRVDIFHRMTPRQPSFGTTGIGARTKQLFCQQIFEVVLSQFLFRLKAKTNTFLFFLLHFSLSGPGGKKNRQKERRLMKGLKDQNQQNNNHQHIFTNTSPLPS